MKRVLFVDDEPKLLEGLRRTLRSLRRAWHMEFAEGGTQALDCLAGSTFDVVITDMRMRGMNGAELLEEVMKLYPATVRIILSGQCDRQTVLKCVGPAHQFLTKPCTPDTLKTTVARACRLRDQLQGHPQRSEGSGKPGRFFAALRMTARTVSRVTSVPSLPSVYAEFVAELESARGSIQRVAEIVSRDVGMTAKILQLVSSGFFGSPRLVSTPAEAVRFLGLDTIRPLTFSTKAFFPFEAKDAERRWLERLIDHSLAAGMMARAIAEAEMSNDECRITKDPVLAGNAFLAGFLHDVGTLVLAEGRGASGGTGILRGLVAGGSTVGSHSARRLDRTHASAGAYLMALWSLPDPIIKAIAFYHGPSRSPDQTFTPLSALHVAHAVLEAEALDAPTARGSIDLDYLTRIGCADRLDTWLDICRKEGRGTRGEGGGSVGWVERSETHEGDPNNFEACDGSIVLGE